MSRSDAPLSISGVFLIQQPTDLIAQRRGDVLSFKSIRNVGDQETDLGTAVEALAFELQPKEWLYLGEAQHGVGQLDFAAGAARLRSVQIKHFGLQDVTSGDAQVGRCVLNTRLLDHAGDLEGHPVRLADSDDA